MFRHVATVLTLLLVLAGLGGCIPSQRQLAMERDLAEMKRRLAVLEKNTSGVGREFTASTEDRLAELGRRQAESQAGLDGLRVDIQSIHGRMEDLRQANGQFQDEMSLMRDDLSVKVSAIEQRLAGLEQNPTAAGSAAPKPAPSAPTAVPVTAEETYEQGLALVRDKGEFSQARKILQDFLKHYPGHPLSVNATYWIGEAYYGEKNYENAILQFQDVIEGHPQHAKVPDALLKQGLAFQALGDAKNARILLQKVVRDHAGSAAARKAKERLQELP